MPRVEFYPSQYRFIADTEHRHIGFSGPVGTGKSFALAGKAVQLALANPGCDGLMAAPTYRMLADITRPAFLDMAERCGLEIKGAGHDSYYIPKCRGTVRFRSMEKPERLIGQNLAWFGVDELTYCKPDAWRRLEARLREPRAMRRCGFAAWTPKGFDWVYERFIGPEKKPGHAAILATPGENRAILSADSEFYERLKGSYDERFFAQEVLGEYLNVLGGSAYHAFSRFDNNSGPYDFRPREPVFWTHDFNVNPLASVYGQHIREDGGFERVYVAGELFLRNAHTEMACQAFCERMAPVAARYPPLQVEVFGDYSGNKRSTTSFESDYDVMRRYFEQPHIARQFTLSVNLRPSGPVRERVNSVNGAFRSAAGVRRLWVDVAACPNLVRDLEQVVWKNGDLDKNSNPDLTHVSDALGYYVVARLNAKGVRFGQGAGVVL